MNKANTRRINQQHTLHTQRTVDIKPPWLTWYFY